MNNKKLEIYLTGGKHLALVKQKLSQAIKAGITPLEIDCLADTLIKKWGDQSSFKTVANYQHATCININSGMVHGVPGNIPFKSSDVVTVDVGLIHRKYHFDTSFTLQIPPFDSATTNFLYIGQLALKQAIAQALPGNSIYQVSLAMQQVIEKNNFSVITQLTGHGVGKKLHLPPSIPCFASSINKKDIIKEGQTLAIEIMYAQGKPKLKLEADNWTMSSVDGSLTAMFEETILITNSSNQVLTNL